MPSNVVDERIVAAKFDSSQFEKGVDKTVKKLDELKKSLKLKDSDESITEISKKTSEATKSMSENMDKLTERITSFTGMLKQKLLSGIADEIVGVFFKMENAIKSFVRSVSTDQISAGMSKYEQMLTSVRLITNAKKSDGTKYTQAEAYKSIEQLGKYSDQTSYSLNQMTDALSKMTAAGVSLDDATKSVMGIANACANAGINATDAARAFFNLSQAYGSGSLKYTDYRSLELLNMADAQFKEQMLKAAVVEGTLKEVKKGVYKTVKKKGTKVTGGKQVTEKNLSESLKYGWATNDVMNTLFGKNYYWGALDVEEGVKQIQEAHSHEKALELLKDEYKDIAVEFEKLEKEVGQEKALEQLKKKHGSIAEDLARDLKDLESECDHNTALEKLKKKYGEVGYNAYMAAKEARNFTDVINTIKDVVATGWSKTWEKLFGQLDTATKFFTMLSGEDYDKDGNALGLANAIFAIGEWRSEALETWDEGGGGDVFRSGIIELNRLLGDLVMMFTELLPSSEDFGEILFMLTMHFQEGVLAIRHWVWQVNTWLNSGMFGEGTKTRLMFIRDIIGNISSVFSIAEKVITLAISSIATGLELLGPLFDGVLQALLGITQPISDLNSNEKAFNDLKEAIENFFIAIKPITDTLGGVVKKLGTIIGQVVSFFTVDAGISLITMNIELVSDALGLLIELFGGTSAQKLNNGQGVIEGIAAGIADLINVCKEGLGALKEFFGILLTDLRDLLGLPAEMGEASGDIKNGGLFSGIKNFFDTNEFVKKAQTWFEQAKKDIINWFINLPENINKFFTGLFYDEKIVSSYGPKGLTSHIVMIETPLKLWLDGVVKTVSDFILDLPANLLKALGGAIDFFGGIIEAIFGKKEEKAAEGKNDKKQEDAVGVVNKWLNDFLMKLRIKIHLIPYHIRKFINRAKSTARKSWATIKEWFNNSEIGKTIQSWGTTIATKIKEFILNLPETIKNLIKTAGGFARSIIDTIKDFFSPSEVGDAVGGEINDGFKSIKLEDILNTIKDIGKEIANQLLSLFTGTDDFEKNIDWFTKKITEFISSIPEKIRSGIGWAIKSIGSIWDNIYSALVGTDEKGNKITSRVAAKINEMTNEKGELTLSIEGVRELIEGALRDALDAIKEVWTGLLNALFGDPTRNAQESEAQTAEENKWKTFGENLGAICIEIFKKLPEYIVEGLNFALGLIGDAFKTITDFFSNSIAKTTEDTGEEVTDGVVESLTDASKEEGTFKGALAKLGLTLINLITDTIPKFLSKGFELVKTKWNEWMPEVCKIFEGINNNDDFKKAVEDAGKKIVEWIEQLPEKIKEAFSKAKYVITRLLQGKSLIKDDVVQPIKSSFKLVAKNNKKEDNLLSAIEQVAIDIGDAFKDLFEKHIKPAIIDILSNLPVWLSEGFDGAIKLAGNALEWLTKWFDMHKTSQEIIDSVNEETSTLSSDVTSTVEKNTAGAEKDTKKSSALYESLVKIGQSIAKLITETIPKFIISAFDFIINTDLAKGITDLILSLPETIQNAVTKLGYMLSGIGLDETVASVYVNKNTAKFYDKFGLKASEGASKSLIEAFTSSFDIKGIITDFITVKIPAFITEAFDTVKNNWDSWIAGLYNIFSSEKIKPEDVREKFTAENISKAISDFITIKIPDFVTTGFETLKTKPFEWLASLYNLFNGIDPTHTAMAMTGDGMKNAIVAFLTVKVPAYIKEGFAKAAEKWTEWKTSLENILEDIDWDKVTITSVNFVEKITETIKNIPRDIKGAIEFLSQSISDALKSDKKEPVNPLEEHFAIINSKKTKKDLNKKAKDVKEAAEESDLWSTIQEVADAIGELITAAFNNIGPIIINGWNNTIDTIGKIISAIAEWFSGKDLGTAITNLFPDADRDLKDTINNFAQNLSDLLVTRIPKFLGSSIGKIAAKLPDIVGEFWTSLTEAFSANNPEAVETTEDIVVGAKTVAGKAGEAADAVIGTVGNIWETIKTLAFSVDENGKITGLSWGTWVLIVLELVEKIAYFINSLKLGKSEEYYEEKNSILALLRVAAEALMVGMIFATLASQMNDSQFNKAMTAFDKLGEMIKKIMDSAMILEGIELVSDALEAYSNTTGSGTTRAITYGLRVGKAVGLGILGANIATIIQNLGSTFTQIGASTDLFAKELKGATDKLVEVLPNMSVATECFDKIIEICKKMKTINEYYGSVISGKEVVDVIFAAFSPFIRLTKGNNIHTKEVVGAIDELLGLTDKIELFVKFVKKDDTYENFKWALSTLGASVSLFNSSSLTNIGSSGFSESSIKDVIGFLRAILGDNELMGLAVELTKDPNKFGQSPLKVQEATEKLIVFAGAIVQLGAATKGIEEGMGSNISTFLNELEKIEIDNAGVAQSTTEIVSSIATKFEILASGLEAIAQASDKFNEEKLKTTEYALTMLLDVARKASLFGTSLLGSIITGSTDLTTFASGVKVLGSGLFEFYKSINGEDNEGNTIEINTDKIRTSLQIINSLAEVARILNNGYDGINNLLHLVGGSEYSQVSEGGTFFGASNNLAYLMSAAIVSFNEVAKEFDKLQLVTEDNSSSFKNFTDKDFEKIKQAFVCFYDFCQSIAILGDAKLDHNGLLQMLGLFRIVDENGIENATSLTSIIADFYSNIRDKFYEKGMYSNYDMGIITAAITSFVDVIKALGALYVTNTAGYVTAINKDSAIQIIETIEVLTQNYKAVGDFLTTIGSYATFDVEKTRQVLSLIKLLGETLGAFGAETNNYNHLNLADQGLNQLLTMDPELIDNGLRPLIGALETFLSDPLNAVTLTSIGSSIATYLFDGIQAAFDDPLQPFHPQITPILKLDQAKKDMQDMFGSENLVDVSFGTIIATSIKDVLTNQEQPIIHDYTSDIGAVKDQIGALSEDIKSVATTVSNLKIYLDTGVMVGEMSGPLTDEIVRGDLLWALKNAGSVSLPK